MTRPMQTTAVRFADIQAILNRITAGRSRQGMKEVHSDQSFGWDTLGQLKGVVVRPDGQFGKAYPLIDMDLVRQGRGAETNLVRALADPTGVDSYGRMPYGGPYATPAEIQQIIDWLNAGLPE
jgi:hypothetical protein